jgi:hypothetical protein
VIPGNTTRRSNVSGAILRETNSGNNVLRGKCIDSQRLGEQFPGKRIGALLEADRMKNPK